MEEDFKFKHKQLFQRYGNAKCAIELSYIVDKEENLKYKRYVGKTWENYTVGIKDILYVPHIKHRLLTLWLHEYQTIIKNRKLPDEVERFFLNTISFKYRETLKKYNIKK